MFNIHRQVRTLSFDLDMIPDKIYIGTVTLSSNEPGEQSLLPDWHLRPNPKVANVEYIRKDALIEWIQEARAVPHENAIVRDLAFQEIVNKLISL